MRVIAAALVLVGCGRIGFQSTPATTNGSGDAGAVDPDSTTTPGSRLQLRYWTATDGTRVFASFYDPMIGSRCAFATDSAGMQRCFPSEALTQFAYADAACTTPTLRVANGCASTPTLATIAVSTYSQAVTLGAATPGFVGVFSCSPAVDNATYYRVGTPVPDAMFVAGSQTSVPLADGLARTELVADDGSRQSLGYTYQGVSCRIARLGATTATCIPDAGESIGLRTYSDASCSTEVVQLTNPPAFVEAIDDEAPCQGLRYVMTGAQQMLSTLYVRDSTGGCAPIAQTQATYAAITDVTSTLPVLTRVIDAGSARLRTWAWVSPGGARLEAGLYDSTLGAPCVPTTDTTGITTCALVGFPWQVAHTNAMCNMPAPQAIAICDGDDTAAPTATTPLQDYATCDGLGVPLSTYATKLTTSTGYDSYAGACVTMNLQGATLFSTTTTPYQASRFVALTLQ